MLLLWKVREEIVDPKLLFDDINHKSEQPIALVVFGAYDFLKYTVREECITLCKDLGSSQWGGQRYVALVDAIEILERGENVMVVMGEATSVRRDLRHQLVSSLREHGAKTIVGIYADPRDADVITKYGHTVGSRIAKMREDPPNKDGLEFFVTVSG